MNDNFIRRISLLASAFIGGVICILADLIQKSEASAVLLIGHKLEQIFNMPSPTLFAIGIILIIAISLPLIFESTSYKAAFYAGASVLAILMTITPYDVPPTLKTIPNSVEINLSVSTQDGGNSEGAIVTVSSLDGSSRIARSKIHGSEVRFYLDGGRYRLIVELSGYATESQILIVREGSAPQIFSITLQPSSTPLFIQRIFR